MRLKITFLILFYLTCPSSIFTQPDACSIPAPIAADDCVDACIYCDLDYNGYSGSSAGYTPDGGLIFCGTMHNNQWFAFVALSTTIEFTVQATTCTNNNGLQSVIYPDCNPNSPYIACSYGVSGGGSAPLVVTGNNLTIGQIYWLSIDGWDGDVCSFDLSVTQGTTSPPLLTSIGPITGDTCVDPGEVSTYTIDDLPGSPTPDYNWTWPAGVTALAIGTSLNVNWGSSGGQICVSASNFCNSSPLICIDVFVNDLIPTELVEVICENDCYTLGNNDYCVPGFYSETFADQHGCDSIVNLNLSFHPAVEATGENFVHCAGETVVLSPQINNGQAPYSYLWDTGETSSSITTTSFNSIIHTVTITDICGTMDEVLFNITVLETPEAYLTDVLFICANDPVGILEIEFSGPGPWDLTYMINGVLQTPILNIFDSPYLLNVSEPGEYELVSVNNLDCPGLVFGTGFVFLNSVELLLMGENPSCFGIQDGEVNINILEGQTPYNYSWNNGAGNIPNLSGLGEGVYSVTVTDNFGCTGEANVILTEPALLSINTIIIQEPACFGNADGMIDLTINGGTFPYVYQWNNGSSEQNQDSLSSGIYFVTVTDLNGCSTIDSVSISEPSAIIASVSWLDVSCYGANDGSIDLSVTGGLSPYSYEWSNSSNLEDPSDLSPGQYDVTVSDVNNCTTSLSIDIVEPAILITNVIQIQGVDCSDPFGGSIDLMISGGTMPYAYQWNNGSSEQNPDSLSSGIYFVTATDLNNCTVVDSVEITASTGVTPSVVLTGMITCIDTAVSLDGSGSSGEGPLQFEWYDPDNNLVGDSAIISVNTPGLYNLIISDNSTGCTAVASLDVLADTIAPTANVQVSGMIGCNVNLVVIDGSASTGNGSLSFEWIDPDSNIIGTEDSIAVTQGGIFQLVVTNNDNGCTAAASIEVEEDMNLPEALASVDGFINCANQNVWLDGSQSSGSGPIEYLWLDDAGNTIGTNASIEVSNPGTYNLIITDLSNDCTAEASIEVESDTEAPTPVATVDGNINCDNQSVWLVGGQSSGNGTLEYIWQDNSGNTISTNMSVEVSNPGIYNLIITDLFNNCTAQTSIEVEQDANLPTPIASVNGLINCINQNVWLDGSQSTGNGTLEYIWQDNSGNSISTNASVEVSNPGIYNLIITDLSNNCTAQTSIEVLSDTESPNPEVSVNGILNCINQNVELDGSASTGNGMLEFIWLNINGDTFGMNETVFVNTAGLYTLVITDLQNGCTSQVEVEVLEEIIEPMPEIIANGFLTCSNINVSLNGGGSTGIGILEFEWFDPNNTSIGTNEIVNVNTPGTYTLMITDGQNGCSATTAFDLSQDTAPPVAIAFTTDTITCINNAASLNANNSNGANALIFEWFDLNGNPIGTAPTITVNSAGTFELLVTDIVNGCVDSTSIIVEQEADVPVVDAQVSNILSCQNTQANLIGDASTGTGSLTYNWFDENNILLGTTSTITVDMPGDYTLQINDSSNGCTSETSITVEQNIITPIANAGLNDTINCNQNSVILNGSGSSGNGALIYEWFDEFGNTISNNVSISISQAGTYLLMVMDIANGCMASDVVEISLGTDVPVADAGSDGILDCNTSFITLGGSQTSIGSSINYEWLDESAAILGTDINLLVNVPGLYILVVTNVDNGCIKTDTVLVDENLELPLVDPGPGGVLTCIQSSISLGGPGSSTGAQFTYEWLDSSGSILGTDANFIASSPGNYTLLITNTDNGCSASSATTVTADTSVPVSDAGLGGIITCDVSSIFLNGNNSSGNNLSFEWHNETQMIIGNSAVIEVSESGIFTLIVTNTVNGCSDSDSVQVVLDENLPEAIAMVNDNLTCTIPLVTLDGSASTSPSGNLTFEWFDPNNQSISVLASVNVNLPGLYTLTITDTQNGCTSSTSIQVEQNIDPPFAEAGENLLLTCGNEVVTLNGSGSGALNLLFEWFDDNNISIGNTANLEVTIPGIYNLQVTNTENGCTANDQMEVLIDTNVPVAEAGPGGVLTCETIELLLDGSASSSGSNMVYEWQDTAGNTLGNLPVISIDESGTYTLFVTDTIFNCTAQDDVIVGENIADPIALIDQIGVLSCADQSLVLNADGSLPVGGLSFLWSTPDGNFLSGINTANPEVNEPGTYLVTVTDLVNGCTDSAMIQLEENNQFPEVIIDPPSALTCAITQLELNATNSSQGNDFVFTWTSLPSGGIVSGENTLNPLINQSGQYTLTILNTTNGCENSAIISVAEDVQLPLAVANVEDDLDCITEIVQLNGDGSSVGPIFTYSWSGPNVIDGENTLLPSVNTAGIYNLIVTNIANGCTQSASISVEENTAEPVAMDVLISPPLCFGDEGSMEVLFTTGGQAPYLYSIDGGQNFYASPIFNSLPFGTYSIIVQDAIGCEYEESYSIPFVPELYIDLLPELIVQLGETGEIQAYVNTPLTLIDTIIWTPSEGLSCTNCLTPLVSSFVETLYTITVVDENGCVAEDEIMFRVEKARGVYIPSAFSPNDDGFNDRFRIYAKDGIIKSVTAFQVFSRWGELVFQQGDFDPNDSTAGWDGFFKGEPLQPGVFVYWVEVEFIDGFKRLYKGDVTLMR